MIMIQPKINIAGHAGRNHGSIRRITLVALCALCVLCTNPLKAQTRVDLRTNLLTWAVGSPGLGVSLGIGPCWQVGIDGSYGNWNVSHRSTAIRISTAGAEARRYLQPATEDKNACRGIYLGLDTRYTHFNHRLTDIGREGDLITAGILVGYTFCLGHPRWSLDASLGCGYIHRNYERYTWYEPAQDFRYLDTRTRNGFGLTNLSVSIAYRLPL